VVRNGLRAIAYGTPGGADGGTMELKFLASNADVREGDVLTTSGLDGVYLPGLPVATVLRIEREAGYAFARIICKPAAGIDHFGQVLVLTAEKQAVSMPAPETEEKSVKGKRRKLRAEAGDKGVAAPEAPAAPGPGPNSAAPEKK
jgi:rod shape-determining protein MreC